MDDGELNECRAVSSLDERRSRLFLALWLAPVFLFALTYLRPLQEGDYFWHVNTGRWIVEHRALPDVDPFKFTYAAIDPSNHGAFETPLFLKGYWLASVGMAVLDAVAGPDGFLCLRVVAYGGLLAWAAIRMRRAEAGIAGFAAVVLLAVLLGEYPNERPQLFSFLAFAALLHLLERMEEEGADGLARRGAAILSLMLVWANVHGGYLLGIATLGVFGAGRLLDRWRGRNEAGTRELAVTAAAICVTALNPNGWGFLRAYGLQLSHAEGAILSHEHLSTLGAWREWGEVYYSYWLSLALACCGAVLGLRRLAAWRLALLLSVAALSLSALRHMILLPLVLPLAAPAFAGRFPWRRAGVAAALLCLGAGLVVVDKRDMLRSGLDRHFPVKAADFLADTPLRGNLFNFQDWGGYLAYRLPGRKVFLDGRNTVEKVSRDHDAVLFGPAWRDVLSAWGVNVVLLPGVSQHSGAVFPIVFALASAPEWALVYADDNALMFARDIPEHGDVIRSRRMERGAAQRHIAQRTAWLADKIGDRKTLWMSKGSAHLALGEWGEAASAFERALTLDPGDGTARLGLDVARRQGGGGG